MLNSIESVFSDLLTAVTIAAIPIIVAFVAAFLKKLTEAFSARILNDYSERKVMEIEGIVSQAVAYVAQTYVDDLKELNEFNQLEQRAALTRAIQKARSMLTRESLAFLSRNYQNADAWLQTRIELEVRESKLGPTDRGGLENQVFHKVEERR